MRAVLTATGVLLGLVVVGVAPAGAAGGYAGNNPDGMVLNSTVVAGEDVVFVADCFAAGTTAAASVDGPGEADISVNAGSVGTDDATGTVDAEGAVRAVIEATATGTYTVTATGERTCASGAADATFTVVAASAAGGAGGGTGGGLARTGAAAVAIQLGVGAGLVGVGALVVFTVSRRRGDRTVTAA